MHALGWTPIRLASSDLLLAAASRASLIRSPMPMSTTTLERPDYSQRSLARQYKYCCIDIQTALLIIHIIRTKQEFGIASLEMGLCTSSLANPVIPLRSNLNPTCTPIREVIGCSTRAITKSSLGESLATRSNWQKWRRDNSLCSTINIGDEGVALVIACNNTA